MKKIYLSIVVPIYNEEANISTLYKRLKTVLTKLRKNYEIIFIDDGSDDSSPDKLKQLAAKDGNVVVLELTGNFGQHAAIMAGFKQSSGDIVITLDADLQNPPEEIPKLVAKMKEGYDIVGGWRKARCDSIFRKTPSFFLNALSSRLFNLKLKDYGCMLRAYKKNIIKQVIQCPESITYIPALANSFAKKITEIPVQHSCREKGKSKYGIMKLLRLNFDLMTGFSLLPIQLVGFAGIFVALTGIGFAAFLFIRRLVVGPEVEGVFTLFAILFIFIGLQILALGILGEYIGRIYREVRKRPQFIIKEIHKKKQSR